MFGDGVAHIVGSVTVVPLVVAALCIVLREVGVVWQLGVRLEIVLSPHWVWTVEHRFCQPPLHDYRYSLRLAEFGCVNFVFDGNVLSRADGCQYYNGR